MNQTRRKWGYKFREIESRSSSQVFLVGVYNNKIPCFPAEIREIMRATAQGFYWYGWRCSHLIDAGWAIEPPKVKKKEKNPAITKSGEGSDDKVAIDEITRWKRRRLGDKVRHFYDDHRPRAEWTTDTSTRIKSQTTKRVSLVCLFLYPLVFIVASVISTRAGKGRDDEWKQQPRKTTSRDLDGRPTPSLEVFQIKIQSTTWNKRNWKKILIES